MEEDIKEIPLKERIEKLLESGWINEFNYLENQLQEARSLVIILQQKVEQLEKENKELKEKLEPIKKLNIPVEILVSEFERLEDIEDRKVQIEYDLVFKKGVNHMKSKIEDKIEELDEMKVDGEVFGTAVNYAKLILKSILEE